MKNGISRSLSKAIFIGIKNCTKSPIFRIIKHEKSFTRNRKLSAENVLSMIIEPAKQSLQTRLYEFGVKFMGGVYVTKQAFSKQRQFVNPDFIRGMFDENVDILINEGELRTFKGMHLTAVDGTRVACENTSELIAEFGCSGSKKDACTALASVVYDVMERVAYDCQIGSYSTSERELLNKHLDKLETYGAKNFLIIGDRGYPSYDLMETLVDRKFSFILRLSECWTNTISWHKNIDDTDFQYKHKDKTYTFRTLKIELPDKNEYLITNLDGATLSLDEAKSLYSSRWSIETFFSFIKSELELENFSGKTKVSILQEFYATMIIANTCLCFINDADNVIATMQVNTKRKFAHQANRRQSVGQIVQKFIECFVTNSERKQNRLLKEIEMFCEKFSEPIRPGRNPKRKTPRDKKFYSNARKPRLS